MSNPRILLVDNDADFLHTCEKFLRLAGYEVDTALTTEDARTKLEEGQVDLAILDIRLADDWDEKDLSGLILATESSPAIPKIILTAFQTWEAVRDSLGTVSAERPPAVDFVAKQEGLDTLLQYIKRTVAKYVHINRDLNIDWKGRDRFSLVNLIDPGLEDGRQIATRANELEDLLCRLFHDKSQIKIDRVLWHRERRVALSVYTFAEARAPETLVVVCGPSTSSADEARRYQLFAPKAPSHSATVLCATSETWHIAANAYTLAGSDLQNVYSLAEAYRAGPDRAFNATLSGLFDKTLAEWHREQRVLEEGKTFEESYRERLGLTSERISQGAFEERVRSIVRQSPTIGETIDRASKELTFQFGGRVFSYPDPTTFIEWAPGVEQPVVLMNTPGVLSGDNILADADGHVWLTDFASAGLAPVMWNFVSLEAAIRFDWIETSRLQWLHEMEQSLLSDEFSRLDVRDIEQRLRKPLRAIQSIRRFASHSLHAHEREYHLGVLFEALRRLWDFDPVAPIMTNDLARMAHVLLSAAMITHRIGQIPQIAHKTQGRPKAGIRIDKATLSVWVDGARVRLGGHGYDLLCSLYDHHGRMRTRKELVEQVFGERYDEGDNSQIAKLNTAIRRLRERIEIDPDHPRYILTETGVGYRLAFDQTELPRPK